MEAQKTIIIAYDISPHRVSEILSNPHKDSFANLMEFLSWKPNRLGRLILTLEQYLKHTKMFDEICYFPFDQTYHFFPNGTLSGLEGKMNAYNEMDGENEHIMSINIWEVFTC